MLWALAFILGTFSLWFLIKFLNMLCRKQTYVSFSSWPMCNRHLHSSKPPRF